jgi:tRNA (guanine6-N2)-methyltransferase
VPGVAWGRNVAAASSSEVELLLTGNPGTEDIIALEAKEELYATRIVELREGHGRVIVSAPWQFLERVYSMRSIHSAALIVKRLSGIDPGPRGLEEIAKAVTESPIHKMIPADSHFAVNAVRAGEHSYTSIDIARVVGEAILRNAESEGVRLHVRLNSPQTIVEAHLIEDTFILGLSLSGGRSLHRRGVRVYDHPAALKPTLAYSMLRLAGARDGDTIVDPMCGGGTVAIEAAWTFISSRIYCIDINRRHIEGARLNAGAARVAGRIRFIVGDARRMHEILGKGSVDVVVSNPPYGIRMGSPATVRGLYREFIPSLKQSLRRGGRAALITTEGSYLARLALRSGLKVTHRRRVRHGDLWATILVLARE